MKTLKRRRHEGKTDYKARTGLLKNQKGRVVFRRTNKYIIGQYVKSEEARDYVVAGLTSKELLDYGWPKEMAGSLKSMPASYLAGFLLGKKMNDKDVKEAVFYIGLIKSIGKSRAYSFLKGVIDAGVKIKSKQEVFPDESRIKGRHMKKSLNFEMIINNINRKFA